MGGCQVWFDEIEYRHWRDRIPMNDEFRSKLNAKLGNFRDWMQQHSPTSCRLVQYCGVERVSAHDIPLAEIENRIEGLLCEGFYVDWTEQETRLYLRVWEFGGPEPTWPKVFAEEDLEEIPESPEEDEDDE